MRSDKQIKKRNAKLLYRHNHLLSQNKFSYEYIINTLSEEFYLEGTYIEQLVKDLSQEKIMKPRRTTRR